MKYDLKTPEGWQELGWKIDNEEFGYFFRWYAAPSAFEDSPELQAAVEEYVAAAKKIEAILLEHGVDA